MDAVMDVVAKSVSVFLSKGKHKYVVDLVLLLLVVTKFVFDGCNRKICNKNSKILKWKDCLDLA